MEHSRFKIGETFKTATGVWRCTDIGTRIIATIKISDHDDPSWLKGPPYPVCEIVFDEYDMPGCDPCADLAYEE